MARHSFTIASPLTVQDAFARLIDLERVPEWDEGVRGSVRIGPTPDSVLGSRFEVTVTGFDGTPTTVVYELTEVDEPTRFVMIGENEQFRAADTLVLTSNETGCELSYDGTLELLGDDPPLTPTQLDSMFPKLAAVAEAGLRRFLDGER
jgi:hypothetical protein